MSTLPVKWAQRANRVYLTILVHNMSDLKASCENAVLKVTGTGVVDAVKGEEKLSAEFSLFGPCSKVEVQEASEVSGRTIVIWKEHNGYWRSLTDDGVKKPGIGIDWARFKDEADSDVDSDDEFPVDDDSDDNKDGGSGSNNIWNGSSGSSDDFDAMVQEQLKTGAGFDNAPAPDPDARPPVDLDRLCPLVLAADSRALFSAPKGFWSGLVDRIEGKEEGEIVRMVYVGVSNGDEPVFYELARDWFMGLGLKEGVFVSHVKAEYSSSHRESLRNAHVVLLSGGDVDVGWEGMKRMMMDSDISEAFYAGALVIGVSAGAMHMGLGWRSKEGECAPGMSLAPFYVSAHDERTDWESIKALWEVTPKHTARTAIGVPSGGIVTWNVDEKTLKAVGCTPLESRKDEDGQVVNNLLLGDD